MFHLFAQVVVGGTALLSMAFVVFAVGGCAYSYYQDYKRNAYLKGKDIKEDAAC